jgi:hypothetical protein
MEAIQFEDKLEPLGILTGAILVLMGLGTLVGQPWTTTGSAAVSVLQLLGVGLTVAIGVALAWLSYVQE